MSLSLRDSIFLVPCSIFKKAAFLSGVSARVDYTK